jgi:hypothetical protein
MRIQSSSFSDGTAIPSEFAFAVIDQRATLPRAAIEIRICHGMRRRKERRRLLCSATTPAYRAAPTT